jgi:hypothetical protein
MNKRLLAGLIPALGLSMGSLCNMMAEGVPDGAAGGGTAPPAQPSAAGMMPIIPPSAPPVAPPPVAPPAAAPPPAAPQYVTHEMFAESEKRMRETIQDTLKALLSGGAQLQAQPQAPPVAAATPPAAPAAPPVPPQPPVAQPPAPAPQQQQQLDPALLSVQREHEVLKQRQAEYEKQLQQMKAEKEAAEEKAALIDTQIAVRNALEKNSKYKLTPDAVTAAAEVLMLKGVVNRSKENKRLYLELGIDQASGQKKFELLETGIDTWLDTPDAKIYKQVVPPGMGFQGSAAGGVPMSFPQGVNPARGNHLGQVEYATAAAKALLPS